MRHIDHASDMGEHECFSWMKTKLTIDTLKLIWWQEGLILAWPGLSGLEPGNLPRLESLSV